MHRAHARRTAAALAACLSLAPLPALGDDAADLDAGIAAYGAMAAQPGSATPEGCAILERLLASAPTNPVYLAYAGGCQTVVARDAKGDDQAALALKGVARVQQALSMLGPEHDEAELRGVPQSIETRLAAAMLFAELPRVFRLEGEGQAAAAAAMKSPAWARTPAPIRARLERLAAAKVAPTAPAPALDPALVTTVSASVAQGFAGIDLPGGYRLYNNPWNQGISTAEATPFADVFRGTGPSGEVFGWRWNWPGKNPTVAAYPEVIYGTTPWEAKDAPFPKGKLFPFHPGARKVTARYDAALTATGSWNLAFELWAVKDLAHPARTLSHEIMIWTAHGGTLQPAGERIGELTVGGVRYGAWLRRDHGDASGVVARKWTYVAFVAERPVLEGAIELSAFLDWAVKRGLLEKSAWITSVELGNEVVDGEGTLVLRKYAIEVR